MKFVALLIQLACEGHTNAQCYFETKIFERMEECQSARTNTIEHQHFMTPNTTEVEQDEQSICILQPVGLGDERGIGTSRVRRRASVPDDGRPKVCTQASKLDCDPRAIWLPPVKTRRDME